MSTTRAGALVLLLGFAGLMGLFAYQLLAGKPPQIWPSALIGKPVPEFELPPLPGVPPETGLSNADLVGGVTLVNFWASWCVPCEAEAPELMKLASRPGLRVMGVNYKDKPDPAAQMLKRLGNPYGRIGRDETGRAGIDWGISGVPETFVVDSQGRVLARFAGPLTPRDVRRSIDPFLTAAGAPTR